ncbi:glycosyltransferase [Dactylosporangium sp. CA-092794]|uniref:glycosyltransferase n=1 Tax=Dactylosporangium sp. CA-092794 TaxID=3239929 RepID=UPI003D94DDC2
MRVLLSTIGSRGDVQPLAGLALRLRERGGEVRLCVPPDFTGWLEGLGLPVTPIGPELRPGPVPVDIPRSVADQFAAVSAAAEGCDVIVAATALQIAARSVAELRGIPYVFAAYSPNVLPSPHHAPPLPGPAGATNAELWALDAQRFDAAFGAALNAHRAELGLPAVGDVRGHVFGDRPWLAADPVLGPWPETGGAVWQTGAWLVADDRPLSPALEAFLDSGDPPVYFGFGSMRAPTELGGTMVAAARAAGRRAVVSRGWAGLSPDDGADCLVIGEVNQRALFPRVAAVVHHGGAGTTTAAALAGAPQVVVPQLYDQHYWAGRVRELGIGTAHAPGAPTTASLSDALRAALDPAVAERARNTAGEMRTDGADVAAAALLAGA